MIDLTGYHEYGGLAFPAWDQRMPRIARKSLVVLDLVLPHCADRHVAVQAGGNVGVWPLVLSRSFEAVYTFEPDAENFVALALNTRGRPNIVRMQAALGAQAGLTGLHRTRDINCGAHYLEGAGLLPVMRLDDLALPVCSLLYLDIEGAELAALQGARDTIARCRPVIGFEDNGCSQRFGVASGAAETWLAETCGYRVADRISGTDIIMLPA